MARVFWNDVKRVIAESDVIIEVLDSRFVDLSRNSEIEKKIEAAGKPIIFVINKCDLVEKDVLDRKKKKLKHSVFVSSKGHLGTTILRDKILSVAKKDKVVVGVVGYPNTGKSSLINALAGKAKAKASSVSGYTKGFQYVKADNRIKLIDSPGVIPFREDDEIKHALIGSKSPEKMKEPDLAAMNLIEELGGLVELHYDVEIQRDGYEAIEAIAKKIGRLAKGGEADIDTTSRIILKDWQTGRIKHSK
ncbi:GTPase RsgA [Candidatus Woesearchaeota archaeon]|nr:GTPase RsgA [Candidatus Woesearchaeota archaeon]